MKRITYLYLMTVVFFTVASSCNKPSDFYYREHLDVAELAKPGMIDSLEILPGNNRGIIRFVVGPDRRVNRLKISYSTSLSAAITEFVVDINEQDYGTLREILIEDLPEATLMANVQSFSTAGDSSNVATIMRAIYGIRYTSSLNNRIFTGISTGEDSIRSINFVPEISLPRDTTMFASMQRVEIQYPTTSGAAVTISTSPYEVAIALPNLAANGTLRYRTIYRPVETAIDEFYGPWASQTF